MQTSKRKVVALVGSIALATFTIGVAMDVRSRASANLSPNANPTDAMPQYITATEAAIFSGTAATNLTAAQRSHLLNESITNDLAAQLWFRHAMVGNASGWGLKMVQEIRVLESLRAGRTNEAIHALEENLDVDILLLGDLLRVSDETKLFKTTRGPINSMKDTRAYREKFPRKSEDPATDARVKEALSYADKESEHRP